MTSSPPETWLAAIKVRLQSKLCEIHVNNLHSPATRRYPPHPDVNSAAAVGGFQGDEKHNLTTEMKREQWGLVDILRKRNDRIFPIDPYPAIAINPTAGGLDIPMVRRVQFVTKLAGCIARDASY
jgi:hypothetical protein